MRDIIDKIREASSVAVFPHVNEDSDALASCFAFASMLRKMGKKATIYVSGKVEAKLKFIGTDYVAYKSGAEYDHDLCACLDCGDLGRITERKEMFDKISNSINIDHHATNTRFADVNYVDASASATGEILFDLFEEMGVEIDDEIARYLYTAITSDTGCYKYSNTTPKTMRTAARLLEYNFDHAEVTRRLFDCEPLNSIKLRAEVMGGIRLFEDGKISFVSTDEKLGEKYGMAKEDIPNLVDIPRRVEGAEIAVCIKRIEGGFRANFRSNGDADVAKVAMRFGGGGHVRASGATIRSDNTEETERAVIEACREALEEIK